MIRLSDLIFVIASVTCGLSACVPGGISQKAATTAVYTSPTPARANNTPSPATQTIVLAPTSVPTAIPQTSNWTPVTIQQQETLSPTQPSYQKISAGNAGQIREITRYGSASVFSIRFSSDGTRVVVLFSDNMKVYDVIDGKSILAWSADLVADHDAINSPSLSNDGSRVAAITNDQRIKVFDQKFGEIFSTRLEETDYPWVALSPGGNQVAYPVNTVNQFSRRWTIVDVASGMILNEGNGEKGQFSPDGKYYAAEFDNSIYIWNTLDWLQVTTFGYENYTLSWSLSSDGRIAIALKDVVTVWDIEDRIRQREINGFTTASNKQAPEVSWSVDNQYVALLDAGKAISVWNVASGEMISRQATGTAIGSLRTVSVNSDGSVTIFSNPGSNNDYQLHDNSDIFTLDAYDDRVVLGTRFYDPFLKRFNIHACNYSNGKGECVQNQSKAIGTDGYGNIYTLDSNHILWVGELDSSGDEVAALNVKSDVWVQPLAVSKGSLAYVYYRGWSGATACVQELDPDKIYCEYMGGRSSATPQYSADGNRVLFWSVPDFSVVETEILVFDRAQNAVIFRFAAEDYEYVNGAALSPDGNYLAYHYESRNVFLGTRIVELLSQRIIAELEVPGNPFAYSPDSSLIASIDGADGDRIYLIDIASQMVVNSWSAHVDEVFALDFSPDGRYLASVGRDGYVKVWGVP